MTSTRNSGVREFLSRPSSVSGSILVKSPRSKVLDFPPPRPVRLAPGLRIGNQAQTHHLIDFVLTHPPSIRNTKEQSPPGRWKARRALLGMEGSGVTDDPSAIRFETLPRDRSNLPDYREQLPVAQPPAAGA